MCNTQWQYRTLIKHLCVGVQNGEKLDSVIIYDRDFDYDYFGFKVHLHAPQILRFPATKPQQSHGP